jgi:hypothetical protein
MFGLYCTVRLYVPSGIAPSAYMSCTLCLHVFSGVALSAYMFGQSDVGQKLTESCGKTLLHRLPICWCTLCLYVWRGKREKPAGHIAPHIPHPLGWRPMYVPGGILSAHRTIHQWYGVVTCEERHPTPSPLESRRSLVLPPIEASHVQPRPIVKA